MNGGIIASRYASALLKLVEETGSGDLVAAQVRDLLKVFSAVPEFAAAIGDPDGLPAREKVPLLETALGETRMASDLKKFVNLLAQKGRIDYSLLIFNKFIRLYNDFRGIRSAKLTVPAIDETTDVLKEKLSALVTESTGYALEIETVENPSIIGGFILEMDDKQLDASVSHQLDLVRRQFVANNKRLV